ncbi:four helix bundle suffix domain-containing protein [Agriterribacter sp.]|uniref:four helix bundle suffix domain-containing protein n=1 Tax=Agriterribacter sp. TaxID=2821509 RepID=UPI002B9EA2D4|nr:four helix bundle suffix domain-containing protein [Agriterribacter sp.]HRP57344.1 four helix bundle suffix domain-containing protein [Agriterribacter sp.]
MDANEKHTEGFIPTHGGYRNLITFQKAEIIYDGTVFFCNRYFSKYDRTREQMIQAARSGKQNIAEASMASATFQKAIEHEDAGISANVLRSLSKVNIYLPGQQIVSLEKAFIKEGGLRERMTNARLQHRNK